MATNDRIAGIQTVLTTAIYEFRPGAGINWMLKNIIAEADGELYFKGISSGLVIKIDSWIGNRNFLDKVFHCSNGFYYYFKNTNVASKKVHYDGIITNDGATGDTLVQGISTIASSAVLTVQPSAGQEWVIHNLMFDTDCRVNVTNGTDTIAIGDYPANTMISGLNLILNNTNYLTLTNIGVASGEIGYDGIRTK
jgi:hypothetical protein